jgi:Tfp pilus assembly protein PilO
MAFGTVAYGVLVLVYLFAYHWDLDARREKEERKAQLLETEARNFEITESKRPEFHRELRHLEGQLSVLNMILPPEALPETVLLRLTTAAREAGVLLVEATPGAPRVVPGEAHAVLPWTLAVRGGFSELQAFCARIPRLARLLHVRSLALQPAGSGYLATLALDTFQHVRADTKPHAAAEPCERDEAGLFDASDAVAAAELVTQERTDVPGALEVVRRYRIVEVFKGSLQPGARVEVRQTCVARSAPLESDGYPPPVERCPESAAQATGGARVIFAQTLSTSPDGPYWDTPRFGGAAVTCRAQADAPGLDRLRAWQARSRSTAPRRSSRQRESG